MGFSKEKPAETLFFLSKTSLAVKWTHIAGVVDESRKVAIASSVDDGVAVDSEQITAADANCLIALLTQVSDCLTYDLSHVLYYHLTLGDRLQRKQTPVVDPALGKLQLLLAEL